MDSQHNSRVEVERLYYDGLTVTAMATKLRVHRHTISSDLDALQLEVFTTISDHDLDEVAAEILAGIQVHRHRCAGWTPFLAWDSRVA